MILLASIAHAQELRFIDESGNIHWVERLEEVPPRYRNQVVPPTPAPQLLKGQRYNPQREQQKRLEDAARKKRSEDRAKEIAQKKLERDQAREAKLREKEIEKKRREQKKADDLARKEEAKMKRDEKNNKPEQLPANKRPGPDPSDQPSKNPGSILHKAPTLPPATPAPQDPGVETDGEASAN